MAILRRRDAVFRVRQGVMVATDSNVVPSRQRLEVIWIDALLVVTDRVMEFVTCGHGPMGLDPEMPTHEDDTLANAHDGTTILAPMRSGPEPAAG